MKRNFLLYAVLVLATSVHLVYAEEFTVSNMQDRPAPSLNASPHIDGFQIVQPDGAPLLPGVSLPEGYVWDREGRLHLPDNVILEQDGKLELPNNEYPERYDIKSNGDIEAPDGFILRQGDEKEEARGDAAVLRSKQAKQEEEGGGDAGIEDLLDFDARLSEEAQRHALQRAAVVAEASEKEKVARAEGNNKGKKEEKAASQNAKKPTKAKRAKKQKGEKLEIPADAYANQDLSFLGGCWKSGQTTGGYWNRSGRVAINYIRYCFDRRGRGQWALHEANGFVYRGPATAVFAGRELRMKTGNAYANGKGLEHYTPKYFECNGSDRSTICRSVAVNPDNPRDVRRSVVQLYKD